MANPIMVRMAEEYGQDSSYGMNNVMTVNGTLQITAFLGILMVAAAAFCYTRFSLGYADLGNMLFYGGAIIGFILAIIIYFAKTKVLIPVYAVCEGLALGGISSLFESLYPGIVLQAVTGTFVTFFAMLILYRTGIIACTDKFRSVVFTSTFSIAGVYLVDFIGHFFNFSVPVINSASNIGIGFSVVVVIIAALNLIIDFDFIERGVQMRAPKDYEWFGAFGLLITIVWLYIEILKLLAKVSSRR